MTRKKDIYGRRPISNSRGRTDDRILSMQHDRTQIPGPGDLLHNCPDGSIGATVQAFVEAEVATMAFTPQRTYERTIQLLVHDLATNGPQLDAPASELTPDRVRQHIAWRRDVGMNSAQEIARLPVHLTRIGGWFDDHAGTDLAFSRERLLAWISPDE